MVDMNKLLSIHSPASDSPEARTNAINNIRQAIALCAAAHDCAVVLDLSGKSENGIPFVISAAETLDLTDEVIRQLGQR
jgi:hypothetical protein